MSPQEKKICIISIIIIILLLLFTNYMYEGYKCTDSIESDGFCKKN
jgi:hypothetical protein